MLSKDGQARLPRQRVQYTRQPIFPSLHFNPQFSCNSLVLSLKLNEHGGKGKKKKKYCVRAHHVVQLSNCSPANQSIASLSDYTRPSTCSRLGQIPAILGLNLNPLQIIKKFNDWQQNYSFQERQYNVVFLLYKFEIRYLLITIFFSIYFLKNINFYYKSAVRTNLSTNNTTKHNNQHTCKQK